MIKLSECNSRQKKAYLNFKGAAIDYIFGLQNGCLDSEKGSTEYQDYYAGLEDLESLIGMVYSEGISTVYSKGMISSGKVAEAYLKDIRFCGKQFLEELAVQFCTKFQREALDELRHNEL